MNGDPLRESDVDIDGDHGRCCRFVLFYAMRHGNPAAGDVEYCDQCSRDFAFNQGRWVNVTPQLELIRKEAS